MLQWDHGLSIYQTEPESPEAPLLGLAEVAAGRSAAAVGGGARSRGQGLPGWADPAEPHLPRVRRPSAPLQPQYMRRTQAAALRLRPVSLRLRPEQQAQPPQEDPHRQLQPHSPCLADTGQEQAHRPLPRARRPCRSPCQSSRAEEERGLGQPRWPGPGTRGSWRRGSGRPWWGRHGALKLRSKERTRRRTRRRHLQEAAEASGQEPGAGAWGQLRVLREAFHEQQQPDGAPALTHGERPYASASRCPTPAPRAASFNRHRRMHGLGPSGASPACPHCCVPFRPAGPPWTSTCGRSTPRWLGTPEQRDAPLPSRALRLPTFVTSYPPSP